MNKEQFLKTIYDVIDFLVNGKVVINGKEFNGHPKFYLLHSKEEMQNMLIKSIEEKEIFDIYDLFYYFNLIFKYLLNQYDSHTVAFFRDSQYLPLVIKIIDDKPYIIACLDSLKEYKGAEILKINGIDIAIIMQEFERIICYASKSYLEINFERYLTEVNALKSLPNLNRTDKIVFTTNKGEISFDVNDLEDFSYEEGKENYQLDIDDNVAIITYNWCYDIDKMHALVEKLRRTDGIDKYIVDIRGNGGGNSLVNKPLVEFLKDKQVVTLCDERTYSSARMCLIDLKNNGAKVIGTVIGTPINCFGNSVMKKELQEYNLFVNGSATYWYYDADFICHGFYKEDFDQALIDYPKLLDSVFIEVDEEIRLSLDDYINGTDSVLEYAIAYMQNDKVK